MLQQSKTNLYPNCITEYYRVNMVILYLFVFFGGSFLAVICPKVLLSKANGFPVRR